MYTTNTASSALPTTYTTLRDECEKILKIAKDLERQASNGNFEKNSEFMNLKNELKAHCRALGSLLISL